MSVLSIDVKNEIYDETRNDNDFCQWPPVHVGHCAVSWNHYFIVFGGFTSIFGSNAENEEGRYHSTRTLWFYNTETEEWSYENTYGEAPPHLSSAACATTNDCLFVFCGFSRTNFYNKNVYRLDLLTKVWTRIFPFMSNNDALNDPKAADLAEHQYPSGRDKLSCFNYGDSLYLFGGYGNVPEDPLELYSHMQIDSDRESVMDLKVWHNSLIKFDVFKNQFSLIKPHGQIPSPRAACSSCRLNDHFYVYGGRLGTDRMRDMFVLDLKTFTWNEIQPREIFESDNWPQGRSWGVLSPIYSGTKLLLQGGLNADGETLNDFWMFDISTQIWTKLQSFNARLFWHAGCTIDDRVYLFGGFKHDRVQTHREKSSSELITISTRPPSLQYLSANTIAHSIVSSSDSYENDPIWGVLNAFLQPREIGSIQRATKRIKCLKLQRITSMHTRSVSPTAIY